MRKPTSASSKSRCAGNVALDTEELRTSVATIQQYYASHISATLSAAAINTKGPPNPEQDGLNERKAPG